MTTIVCRVCGTSLSGVDEVLLHAERAHPSGAHSGGDILCPGCPTTFRQLLQLQRHLIDAHGM